MTTLDTVCPNYEMVFPPSGEALLTFDLTEVLVPLPAQVVAFMPQEDGLVVTFADEARRVRVHFEALPAVLREQLAGRTQVMVCALDEQGVAFVNDVQIGGGGLAEPESLD